MNVGQTAKDGVNAANLEALQREIGAARERSHGRGLLAINVMRAVAEYGPSVKLALECGIDAVVVGAGLPLDLPDLAQDHSEAALVPILSDARGVQLVVKKWERKKRLPDAIVIEHPRLAGGHLGAAKLADLNDPRFDFENVIPQSLAFLRSAGIEKQVPLIAGRSACAGRCHAVAEKLPDGRDHAAARSACKAALHAGLRLPDSMRAARRLVGLGPVLHRHPAGRGPAWRREEGPLFSRRRCIAVRHPDPQRARTDGAVAEPQSDVRGVTVAPSAGFESVAGMRPGLAKSCTPASD